jgi:hypothetical protein
MLEIIALGAFLIAGWLWVDSMHAREAALEAGRRACESASVQFLDWTVAVVKMRLDRSTDGRLRIKRVYEFEFSDNGDNRLKGSITLLGSRLIDLRLASTAAFSGRPSQLH